MTTESALDPPMSLVGTTRGKRHLLWGGKGGVIRCRGPGAWYRVRRGWPSGTWSAPPPAGRGEAVGADGPLEGVRWAPFLWVEGSNPKAFSLRVMHDRYEECWRVIQQFC